MSLTTTARNFKAGVKILGIAMLVYYVAILFVIPKTKDLILNLLVDRNPPIPKYGLLDPLKFIPFANLSSKTPIILNTTTGGLPAGLPKKMTVYKFKGIQYSYLAGQGAQGDADRLGFSEPELISDLKGKEFRWRSLASGGILTINTETKSILLVTNLFGHSSEYVAGTITADSAIGWATGLLTDLGRFNARKFIPENVAVHLGQFANNQLLETKATADASIAMVDFFGQVEKNPIVGPDAKKGLIRIWLQAPTNGGGVSPFAYPNIEYNSWDLVSENDASYPIISVNEAWKQLLAGKGIVSSITLANANPFAPPRQISSIERILINKIYLAYYETPEFQKYLQPIYVFEGSFINSGQTGGSIIFYYPAVTAEFTNKVTSQPTTQQSSPSN